VDAKEREQEEIIKFLEKYNSVLIYKPVQRQKPVNISESYDHSTPFFYDYIYCPTIIQKRNCVRGGGAIT
jgi:hypothetical protein